MAEIVTVKGLPADYEVACTSDWHCGSRAFHEQALDRLIAWVRASKKRYLGFGGDAIEGKRVDSPHFNPDGLRTGQLTMGPQLEYVRDRIRPIADSVLWWNLGNHDIYCKDADLVRSIVMEPLGIRDRLGGYQTWVELLGKGAPLRGHIFHGHRSLPRGAKDPIQKRGNQNAWLVNELYHLAGDVHFHLMGHVHALLVQQPVEQYALLTGAGGVRARYFVEPEQPVETHGNDGATDSRRYIPPRARWYGCTGTLRRSGGFGYTDYAEIAGYPPSPIGWLVMKVRGGVVRDLAPVIV